MITTVTLNAAIDITYYINDFKTDKMHRITKMYKEPGGKGLNVAKTLKQLGAPVITTGFLGGYNGNWIKDKLDYYQIKNDFEHVNEESRLCLNIVDDSNVTETELLEQGPNISPKEYERFKQKLNQLAKKSMFIAFSGSLPLGVGNDTYAELIELVQGNGSKAILDTSGPALHSALSSKPFMVKPNRSEMAFLLGKPEITEEEILSELKKWHESGIKCSVVSLGAEGFIANIYGQMWKVIPPAIQSVNSVGCGDTLVGALLAGIYKRRKAEEFLCESAAAAAANAMERQAGKISIENIDQLKQNVKLITLS